MTKHFLKGALAVLWLAACDDSALVTSQPTTAVRAPANTAANGQAPAAQLITYQAAGAEPWWSVTIKDGRIIHDSLTNLRDFTVPVTQTQRTSAGWQVAGSNGTASISLVIELNKTCSDGMSERVYQDKVLRSVNGSAAVHGCGGAFTGPELP